MLRINSATKNLLLTFPVLVERIRETTKQMLHGVYPEIAEGFSMTNRKLRPSRRICFPWRTLRLCASHFSLRYAAREILP
jgi:hypothetical protein